MYKSETKQRLYSLSSSFKYSKSGKCYADFLLVGSRSAHGIGKRYFNYPKIIIWKYVNNISGHIRDHTRFGVYVKKRYSSSGISLTEKLDAIRICLK